MILKPIATGCIASPVLPKLSFFFFMYVLRRYLVVGLFSGQQIIYVLFISDNARLSIYFVYFRHQFLARGTAPSFSSAYNVHKFAKQIFESNLLIKFVNQILI